MLGFTVQWLHEVACLHSTLFVVEATLYIHRIYYNLSIPRPENRAIAHARAYTRAEFPQHERKVARPRITKGTSLLQLQH